MSMPAEAVPVRRPGAFRTAARLLALCMVGEVRIAAAGLLLMLSGSVLALLQPWPLKFIMNVVATKSAPPGFLLAADNFVARLIPIGHGKPGLIAMLCAALLLISLGSAAISVVSTWLLISSGLRMVFKLRCRVFEHIQRLPLSFHDATTVGDSLYRVTWDTYSVQSLFNEGLVPGISSIVTLVGIAAVMVGQDWSIAVVAFVIGCLLLLLVRQLEKPTTRLSTRVHENESLVSTRVEQTLGGIRAVQAFGRETHETTRFANQARESLKANLRLTILQTASQSGVAVLFACGTAAIIWMTAGRVIAGQLSPGDIVLMVGYTALLFKPLETLSYTASSIQGSVAGAYRVFEILDKKSSICDLPTAVEIKAPVRGRIEFDHVSFGYRPEQAVLKDVHLTIPAGSSVAMVGPSGAGKTTLAGLIPRFYDPARGRILLDGQDLRSLTLESLRRQIAMVPQEPVLFDVSILENIAYSRPDSTVDEIHAAARAAGAWDFIQALPRGFDTPIGERGVMLSGGQRQRLSLARAFLKDARIILLDEPTTGLDAQTEADLLATLKRLMAGRTTIIIAHHLHTVRHVDQIIVLRGGELLQSGTHDQLIGQDGLYRHLYELQSQPHRQSAEVS
jgi:ATP-binding cassette subfamily B protein/subfamily B ATP-binding cassette protein MsbA